MEILRNPEFWFYICVVVAGATGGFCRTMRDPEYQSLRNLMGIVGSSGLLALGVVSYLSDSPDSHFVFQVRFIGLAGLIGLLGKEPDFLVKLIIRQFLHAADTIKKKENDTDRTD